MVKCAEPEKSSFDAYYPIREGLDFSQRQRRLPFFNIH